MLILPPVLLTVEPASLMLDVVLPMVMAPAPLLIDVRSRYTPRRFTLAWVPLRVMAPPPDVMKASEACTASSAVDAVPVPVSVMVPPLEPSDAPVPRMTEPPVEEFTVSVAEYPDRSSMFSAPLVDPMVTPVSSCTFSCATSLSDAVPPPVLTMLSATRMRTSLGAGAVAPPEVCNVTLEPEFSAVTSVAADTYELPLPLLAPVYTLVVGDSAGGVPGPTTNS